MVCGLELIRAYDELNQVTTYMLGRAYALSIKLFSSDIPFYLLLQFYIFQQENKKTPLNLLELKKLT